MTSTKPTSVVARLRRHRYSQPDTPVFTFLSDGGSTVRELSYRELDRQARSIGAALQQRGLRGKRILLLYVPGMDFIPALYGCFYAGAVAVPAYPPEPERLERALPRLRAIVRDAAPALVLSTSELLDIARFVLDEAPDLAGVPREASERLAGAGCESTWGECEIGPEDVALVQYTSGSTSTPKGVVITHGALSINLEMIQRASRHDASTIICSWLPFYHDFGLVGGILQPVFLGARAVLMSPIDFLQRPIRWLRAIQQYRATDSFVPNFALELCVRKTTLAEREVLDLGSMQLIVVAAEPLRHATLERFADTFAPHGLRREALCPAYGLAEAVVGVSGGPRHSRRRTVHVDDEQLKDDRWVEVEHDQPRARALVGCGQALPGVELVIVDPQTRRSLPSGRIGELWVSGPNVASGYLNRSEESAHTFNARLADGDPRSFLRTGDLAYLQEGELFITGRLKDLIVIRGRNHYPQDIELTVECCDRRVRPGCVAAFSIEEDGEERVAIVAEVDTRELRQGEGREQALRGVIQAIVTAVSEVHSLHVQAIALVKARTIDKTSSGKIARRASRDRFLSRALTAELLWTAARSADEPQGRCGRADVEVAPRPDIAARLRSAAPSERGPILLEYLSRELGRVVGREAQGSLDARTSLSALGLDSLGALELAGRIEHDLQVAPPMGKLLDGMSVQALVDRLLRGLEPGDAAAPARAAPLLTMSLQPLLARRPLFFAGGALGSSLYLLPLARAIGREQPFYALQYPGLDGREAPRRTVEALARRFLDDIVAVQPSGPYALGGHSFGGLVAYEIARQLRQRGEHVSHLLLLDSSPVDAGAPDTEDPELMAMFELLNCFRRLAPGQSGQVLTADALTDRSPDAQRQLLRAALSLQDGIPPGFPVRLLVDVFSANMEAMKAYRPPSTDEPVTLLRAREGLPAHAMHPGRVLNLHFGEDSLGWEAFCGRLRVVAVPGNHFDMVTEPHVHELGRQLRSHLADVGTFEVEPERLAGRRTTASRGGGAMGDRGSPRFNPLRDDYIADPYPLLEELRRCDPVHWSALGAWCVTRHRDIVDSLKDRRLSVRGGTLMHAPPCLGPTACGDRVAAHEADGPRLTREWLSAEAGDPLFRFHHNSMMFADPPQHARLRRLLASAFEPSVVRRWRGFIERTANGLLLEMRQRTDADLIRDFALPLPTAVICEMLGIPAEDVPLLREWSRDTARALDVFISKEAYQACGRSAAQFTDYLREHLTRRRRASTRSADLLTLLTEAAADGERLSEDELLANCLLLFSAGYITTTNVIGNAVLALSRAPAQARLLREQPHLIDRAVEELLRYDGALRQVVRTATEDLVLGDKQVRRGDLVLFMLGAGNRDPEAFPAPNRLDLTRNARNHLAFAHGIHYCLGASLARIELQVAILAVVQRLPMLRILPEGLKWQRSIALRGLEQMRVVFDGEFG